MFISGTLESDDLGLSTVNTDISTIGMRLRVSYDRKPEARIVKAHIVKAAKIIAKQRMKMSNELRHKVEKMPKL